MSEVADVVDRQGAAYRDRDLERFLACYAADVKVKDFDGNVLMDGLEAMRGQYGALFRGEKPLETKFAPNWDSPSLPPGGKAKRSRSSRGWSRPQAGWPAESSSGAALSGRCQASGEAARFGLA